MLYADLAIGQEVKFIGNSAIGECTGTVLELYPPEPDEDFPGAVEMKPHELPQKWPYPTLTFAPWVDELEAII